MNRRNFIVNAIATTLALTTSSVLASVLNEKNDTTEQIFDTDTNHQYNRFYDLSARTCFDMDVPFLAHEFIKNNKHFKNAVVKANADPYLQTMSVDMSIELINTLYAEKGIESKYTHSETLRFVPVIFH